MLDINDRKKKILKSIIDTYISSGEPVGSKHLMQHLDLPVSSATIRNEMSELEHMGYLEQPHTSSGRIPSNSGYRMYVDNLMNRYRLTVEEIGAIDELLNTKLTELSIIVEEATKLFSEMTNYAAVSMTSKPKKGVIKRFEGVLIDSHNVLIIMITSMSLIKSRQMKTDFEIDGNILFTIIKVLNENLAEIPIENINLSLMIDIEDELGRYRDIFSPILHIVYDVITEIDHYQVYLDGVSKLFQYPEYADVMKAQSILSLLEEKHELVELLTTAKSNDINVFIGDENSTGKMNDSSFIFHTFNIGDKIVGAVGLIGPRRMDYPKVMAKLEYFTKHLISNAESDPEDKQKGKT